MGIKKKYLKFFVDRIAYFKNCIYFSFQKNNHVTKTSSLALCRMENCKNLVQGSSFSSSSSPYCDKCISKLEATKLQNEKNEAKNALLKSVVTELPVTHVSSKSKNDISAYNRSMTQNSKLYNVNSFTNSRATSLRPDRDRLYENLSGYNPSNRYIPSQNNEYFNSPSYKGIKETCIYCRQLFLNTSRKTGKHNNGLCENCNDRYGRNQAFN